MGRRVKDCGGLACKRVWLEKSVETLCYTRQAVRHVLHFEGSDQLSCKLNYSYAFSKSVVATSTLAMFTSSLNVVIAQETVLLLAWYWSWLPWQMLCQSLSSSFLLLPFSCSPSHWETLTGLHDLQA